jgi:hypothetical protein
VVWWLFIHHLELQYSDVRTCRYQPSRLLQRVRLQHSRSPGIHRSPHYLWTPDDASPLRRLVYEYSQEASDFGLVHLDSNGSAQLLPDYYTLQKQFDTLNVTYLQDLPALNTSVTAPKCSASLISSKTFNDNFTLPAAPPGAQALVNNGISPAPVGRLVSVATTAVSQTVQAGDGNVIQGLVIIPLTNDESNTPGSIPSATGSIPSTTGSAAPAATSKKSAAVHAQRNWTGLAIAGLLTAYWISLR